MKLNANSDGSNDAHVSWIAALWAALALLAAAAVLSGLGDKPAAQAATVTAVAPAHLDSGIIASDPDAPAASDQLALAP